MRTEVRLAGTGGQGLITAAIILAEAAGIHEGRFVVQSQAYGPEARGGASRADVVIDDQPIHYPKASAPNILLALSQAACDQYAATLKPGGVLIVDADLVPTPPAAAAVSLPVVRTVRETFGRAVFANVTALGVVCGVTGIVSPEALEKAVAARVPAAFREDNVKALYLGVEMGRSAVPSTPHETTDEDL